MVKRVRIVGFAILSVLAICFVFSNSLPSIPESRATSTSLAQYLKPFLDPLGLLPEKVFHSLLRKAAHVVEFGALGICLSCFSIQFPGKPLRMWGMPIAVSVVVAMADEGLQYFTGRGNDWRDVFLDSIGALCGIVFTAVLLWVPGRSGKGGTSCRN